MAEIDPGSKTDADQVGTQNPVVPVEAIGGGPAGVPSSGDAYVYTPPTINHAQIVHGVIMLDFSPDNNSW